MYGLFLFILAVVFLQATVPMPSGQVILAFVGGALGRIVLPFVLEYLNSKNSFEFRKVIGQILLTGIVLIPIVFNDSWMESLAAMSWVASISFGWSSADIGREGQKVYDLIMKRRNGG